MLILAAVPLQSIAFLLGGVAFDRTAALPDFAPGGGRCFCPVWPLRLQPDEHHAVGQRRHLCRITLFHHWHAGRGPHLWLGSGTALFGASTLSSVAEMALAYGGLALAATNLPATLIVSDIFLLQEDALFFYKESFGGYSAYLFSPWWLFLLLYILLALLLYWLTVRRIRKIAR